MYPLSASSSYYPDTPGYTQKHRHTYSHSGGPSTFHPSLRNTDQESVLFTLIHNIPAGYDVMYSTPDRSTSVRKFSKEDLKSFTPSKLFIDTPQKLTGFVGTTQLSNVETTNRKNIDKKRKLLLSQNALLM